MRIAIDASTAAKAGATGIGKYVRSLLQCLAQIDRENSYTICHRLSRLRRRRFFLHVDQPNFRTKLLLEPLNFLFMRGLDVFHGPDARMPMSRSVKAVVTCHDVFSLVSDEFADERFRAKKIGRYKDMVDRATRIVSPSEHTRQDLIRLLGADPARICVIPHGCSDDYRPRPAPECQAVARKHGIGKDFLLYVGILSPRKNTRRILQAFAQVAREKDVVLALAGRPGYGWEEELKPIAELGLEDRVLRLGYVAEEDLPALYSAARAFVFPSLYEGFGIPVLEAMACGTPVVTSNTSSLPEVAGDAALLVDPLDTEAIAEAMRRLLDDEALRASLRAKGLERAKLFPWSRTARETLQVYREVAGA